jgi:hypothetical protein
VYEKVPTVSGSAAVLRMMHDSNIAHFSFLSKGKLNVRITEFLPPAILIQFYHQFRFVKCISMMANNNVFILYMTRLRARIAQSA